MNIFNTSEGQPSLNKIRHALLSDPQTPAEGL